MAAILDYNMAAIHSVKYSKRQISISQTAENPKPITMKFGMIDYVLYPTQHDNLGEGSATWVVWAYA